MNVKVSEYEQNFQWITLTPTLAPTTLKFCGSMENALIIAQLTTKIAGPPGCLKNEIGIKSGKLMTTEQKMCVCVCSMKWDWIRPVGGFGPVNWSKSQLMALIHIIVGAYLLSIWLIFCMSSRETYDQDSSINFRLLRHVRPSMNHSKIQACISFSITCTNSVWLKSLYASIVENNLN